MQASLTISKDKFSFYLTFFLIILASFSMILEREINNAEKLTLFAFIGVTFILPFLGFGIKSDKTLVAVLLIVIASFLYALLFGFGPNYVLQFVIIISSLIPLLLIYHLNTSQLLALGRLLFLIGFIQIFFDLLFPNPNYSELDQYTGTFYSGNDKTRFLFLLLINYFFIGSYFIKVKPFGSFFRFVIAIPGLISIYIGFSLFAYIIFFAAVILAYLVRKFWPAIIILTITSILAIHVLYTLDFDKKSPGIITYTWHRYFDEEHGVAAVYLYGEEIAQDYGYIFGTGLGSWVSRSGQFFKTRYLNDNPATMISYGNLYEDTVAPPGLSSLYVQFVEGGIFFLLAFFILIKALFDERSPNKMGLIGFYFIFLMMNYSPLFFEYQSLSYLFISSFLIFNRFDKLVKTQENSEHQNLG